MSRIVLAMSGGVDSSVAAWLLREAGHEVIGLFMRHGEPAAACATEVAGKPGALPVVSVPASVHKQGCCTAADALDARRVADQLDIPFYAVDFQEDFGRIMDYFVDEYTHARTPNPCVVCNNWIKFGRLWDYAQAVGADWIATGHYARLEQRADGVALCRGRDAGKDQSYVLFGIDREVLPRLMFPVGDYDKPEIRRIAGELGLRVADKKDSQEICFVSDDDYAGFVRRRRGTLDTSGEIVTTAGEVVGRHEGIEHFTIGQRKGLGIAFGERRFVVRLEPESRRVVVGKREDLACRQLTAEGSNWLVDPPRERFDCQVKIRYQAPLSPATVTIEPEAGLSVELHEPLYGVAPGQAVVCFDGERVLGGGWIR